jgi:FKBP-type peptidyl-prolyl cis-trans isomerase FkpA
MRKPLTELCVILCLLNVIIQSKTRAAGDSGGTVEAAAQPTTAPTSQPTRVDNQLAYASGLDFGTQLRDMLKSDHLTADQMMVLRGVIDGLNGLPPLYSEEAMQSASLRVERYAANRRAEELYASNPQFRRTAEENLQRSRALLKENGAMEGTETLSNGIEIKVLTEGAGRVLGNAKTMTVNCRVTLADGTLVRSTEEGKPLAVPCAALLPDVVQAMEGMHVGGKWKIVVPPESAYGLGGKAPLIGPNQAIAMIVELVNAE